MKASLEQIKKAIREELAHANRELGICDGFKDSDYKYLGVVEAAWKRVEDTEESSPNTLPLPLEGVEEAVISDEQIRNAAIEYEHGKESYNDWAKAGNFRETPGDRAIRHWLACVRWLKCNNIPTTWQAQQEKTGEVVKKSIPIFRAIGIITGIKSGIESMPDDFNRQGAIEQLNQAIALLEKFVK